MSSPTPEPTPEPEPEPAPVAAEPVAEIEEVKEVEQPPSPTPDAQPSPQQNGKGADFSSMDLTALKERATSGRKKKGVDASWRNKHALFNNM